MVAGRVYHVISRFVAKDWFIDTEEERCTYLRIFGTYIARTDWRCFAYAAMSSHVHSSLVAGEMPLVDWLQPAHTTYARWLNDRRDERIGAVFVRGPNVQEMRSEGVGVLVNYIHDNPVRAGVVAHASESDWTSYRTYIGESTCPWLDVNLGVELAGFRDVAGFRTWSDNERSTREEVVGFTVDPKPARGRPRRAEASLTF